MLTRRDDIYVVVPRMFQCVSTFDRTLVWKERNFAQFKFYCQKVIQHSI